MKFIKKHLKLIVLILTCILIYIIYNNTTEEKNITYVSLGDGYATSINSYNVNSYGYSDYLKDYLKSNNKLHYYYNYSYKDMKIDDLYKDILINYKNKDNEGIKQILREANLLTLSIGINDIIYKNSLIKYKTEASEERLIKEVTNNMDILIKEIKKYYKYNIYIIGYYNNYPQNSVEKEILDKYNKKILIYSKKNDITYIKIEKNLSKYYENKDSIYPNTLGYEQIYKEILSKITIK